MLIDSHCHIHFQGFKDDLDEVLTRCKEKDIFMNVVGTQQTTSKKAVELAELHDNIYATIGVHPIHLFKTRVDEEESSFSSREEGFDDDFYDELAKSNKVIAVGETGLDLFHIPKDISEDDVLKKQKEVFIKHYNFAKRHDLPLVMHVRDAHEPMIKMLESFGTPIRGVVHCFTGNWEQAQKYLELGCYLGFTGVVTFPPKKTDPERQLSLTKVIEKIPLDRLLVETDAPYLAPQKYRGKRCEPWMVEEVVKWVADRRGVEVDELSKITVENTKKLFSKITDST